MFIALLVGQVLAGARLYNDEREQRGEPPRLVRQEIGTRALHGTEHAIELTALRSAAHQRPRVGSHDDHTTGAQDEDDDQLTHDGNMQGLPTARRSRGPFGESWVWSVRRPPQSDGAALRTPSKDPMTLGRCVPRPLEAQPLGDSTPTRNHRRNLRSTILRCTAREGPAPENCHRITTPNYSTTIVAVRREASSSVVSPARNTTQWRAASSKRTGHCHPHAPQMP